MSSLTANLQLIKPVLSDEIQQTVIDLANNLQKLDDVSELYMNVSPIIGDWLVNKRVWNVAPLAGDYAGWINLRQGKATPKWSSLLLVNLGDLITPTTDNGHYYICTSSGNTGFNHPTFPVSTASTVRDFQGKTTWQPSKSYLLNDMVVPTADNNRFYICTVEGISGVSEPAWSTTDGGTTGDSTVLVWTSYRIVTWQETGIASNFRPFGKIE